MSMCVKRVTLLFVFMGGTGRLLDSISLDSPVEDELMLEPTLIVQLFEQSPQVSIVRWLFELQLSAVWHIQSKLLYIHSLTRVIILTRVSVTELLNGSVDFALFDLSVLIILVPGPQSLPRQFPFKQIQQHIPCPFQVISPTLLDAKMRIGWSVSRCASQTLLISIRDMLISMWVLPSLGQSEVNQVNRLSILFQTNEDVFGFQVSVDVGPCMEGFDPCNQLIGNQKHSL